VRFRIASILLGLLTASASSDGWAAPASSNAPLRVVASFYPIYAATLNVTKDVPGVEVANLTPPMTGCLHDYQMRPQDMVTLSRADIFVVNGLGMESFLDKVMRQMPKLKIIEASRGIETMHFAGGAVNPHVWLSPSLHIQQVRNIAAGLAEYDPARAELYRRNAGAYVSQLSLLRAHMQAELKDIQRRDIITFHEAFPYFAKEFGLNVAAVIEREPGSEPSARDIAAIVETVRRTGVKALFAEPQYSDKAAATIAAETGAKVYILDPAVTGPMTPTAYLRIMERNAEVLGEALK
jgi:zinc transport system substrate-binding protein